ncbi:anthranilate phosphoribosyltransferase [Dehalogenimonas etheniformans]|uniref:Anthranilate phosphoribosyltransferase n=1 Tax=Dehalogenimonas etheniformans TaxID=1536648 RepID=A0A2P5P835_9CHLR|nr:anthranilate phosphoribosyltransferase [Dehalogenimonas etheniformans]PPD58450.1 anthranilate phosphoribosyltransferase [Dehalogenimonas etheniformans]QNT75866.1 anthranilate phosphoribosyltransferase [Dehalogenimonas etheniformans]
MIKEAIETLVTGKSLSADEASAVMAEIMDGQATPAQFGAFVTALRCKGETIGEMVGLARTMRAKALPVASGGPVVDTCGTGGDGAGTLNISTAAAIVAAACGARVAKHGNRAMSSKCGSADVLEALGVRINLTPVEVAECLDKVGVAFMFAPVFHPAMKHAGPPRKEIGIRTVFNLLGPLCNPAGASSQVIGVPNKDLVLKMAATLRALGGTHSLVVHGEGLDELTVTGQTHVCELINDELHLYTIAPEDFGLPRYSLDEVRGGDARWNAAAMLRMFQGETGAFRDAAGLNAAAALLASNRAQTLGEGVTLALDAIDSGKALAKLEKFIEVTQMLEMRRAA